MIQLAGLEVAGAASADRRRSLSVRSGLVRSGPVRSPRCSYVTDVSREMDHESDGIGGLRAAAPDLAAETTAHKYTLCITLVYAACLCPLMVLRSVENAQTAIKQLW